METASWSGRVPEAALVGWEKGSERYKALQGAIEQRAVL